MKRGKLRPDDKKTSERATNSQFEDCTPFSPYAGACALYIYIWHNVVYSGRQRGRKNLVGAGDQRQQEAQARHARSPNGGDYWLDKKSRR